MTFTSNGKTFSIHIYRYKTWVWAVLEGNERIRGKKKKKGAEW